MELSAFLDYKGLPLVDDAPHGQGDGASLVVESPLSFPQNRCIDYKRYTCLHAEAPHGGDLIVELQEDDVADGEVANGREQLLFSYEPFLVSQKSLPFFEYLKTITYANREHLPNRWLQVRVYKRSDSMSTPGLS